MTTKIPLFVVNGKAYVWNSEDWYRLRSQYRICGSLIGTVPSFPRQNDFLGLPMALMSEEVALLVDNEVCELYELPDIVKMPSDKDKQIVKALEEKVLAEQTEALKKRKIEQLSQKIDIIMAGKRKKLLSKGLPEAPLDKQVLLQEEINKLPNLSPAHVLVHLPTECFMNTEKKKVNMSVLNPSIVDGPGTLRYSVFKDLWEREYHITSGAKFGSDYLVYPGDPVKFHAGYMVRCVQSQEDLFSPAHLVTFGRLSVAVNKLALLAYRDVYDRIDYQTLQWHDSIH